MKKRTKNLILFFILFVISGAVFWNYISMHYATDTYNIMNIGYEKYAINNSLSDGRIFMFFIGMFANAINMPINVYVIGLTVIALIVSCICVIVLKDMMLKHGGTREGKLLEFIAILISYCTIFNFMYVENLYFVESAVMSFSILFYILAIDQMMKKKKYYFLKALLLAVLATFCYQGTIGLFIVLGLVFSIIKHPSDTKEIVKEFFLIVVIAGLSFIANLVQIEIATTIAGTVQKRLNGIQNLVENTIYILSNFGTMVFSTIFVQNCGLFPSYLMLIFALIITLVALIQEILHKENRIFLNIVVIFIMTVLVTIAMCVVSITSYDTGRIHFPVGALVGLLLIYLFSGTQSFVYYPAIKYILLAITIIYVLVVTTNTIYVLYEHKEVNRLEAEQCRGLEEYISNYEKANNVKITEARYFKLSNMKKYGYFTEIDNQSVLTYDGVACTWSAIGTINFYTGRNFDDNYLEAYPNKELFYAYAALRNTGYENNFVIMDNMLYFLAYI